MIESNAVRHLSCRKNRIDHRTQKHLNSSQDHIYMLATGSKRHTCAIRKTTKDKEQILLIRKIRSNMYELSWRNGKLHMKK